jgi:L-cystine uptake protein TcyP (sodium:dicarboxylate symporter family)
MLTSKRVLLATLFGIVFGFVCMYLAASNPGGEPMTTSVKWSIVLSRALMGFMIGISALRLKWYAHGIILGAVGSLPMAAATMEDPRIAVSSIVMGVVYGFLIEVLTTVVFKSPPVASHQGI